MSAHHPAFAERLRRMGLDAPTPLPDRPDPRATWTRRLCRWTLAGSVGLCLLFAAAAVWIDYSVFQMRHAAGETADRGSYVSHRLGLSGSARDRRLQFVSRDFTAEPLSLREKAALSRHMSAALPDPPAGWALRPFEIDDLWLLRTDLAHCAGLGNRIDPERLLNHAASGGARCPMAHSWSDLWVYAIDTQRVAVRLHYERPVSVMAFVCMRQTRLGSVMQNAFATALVRQPVAPRPMTAEWRLTPVSEHANRAERSTRLFAQKSGHGVLSLYVLSTTSRGEASRLLGGLNTALMNAMVAPG